MVTLPQSGLVSVIIPVHNSAHYLAMALTSVVRQSYNPIEVIVVDDGSTDDVATVIAQLRIQILEEPAPHPKLTIHYCSQPRRGPAAARNRGVTLARGNFLAFLDADDWWSPEKLMHQVEMLNQQPQLGYVVSHMRVQLESRSPWPASLNRVHYQSEPLCLLPSALVVRRQSFYQVGEFNESYRYSDDADWFLRAKDAAVPFAVVPAPLVYKRIHRTNLSHAPGMTQETLRAVHASVRRQQEAEMGGRVRTL